jgi:hypothetical protein
VFGIGQDHALWHIAWTSGGGWTGWQSLGGGFLSAPTASSWTANGLDVEAVGFDHAMWHSRWNGSTWSAWEWLGGGFTSDPAGISLPGSAGPNRVDVYARGLDGQMYQDTRVDDGAVPPFWTGWQSLGGGFNSGPGVVNTSGGQLVYALGLDWTVYCHAQNGLGWQTDPLGGITHLDPALPTTGVDVVALCFVQDDRTVQVWTIMPQVPPVQC